MVYIGAYKSSQNDLKCSQYFIFYTLAGKIIIFEILNSVVFSLLIMKVNQMK